MNYLKIYKSIIKNSRSKNRKKSNEEYFENHHIVPDFMFKDRKRKRKPGHLLGNPDDPSNLVLLTPREHFLCHVLLYKIYKGSRYEYQTGSALQFFYIKVMKNHKRAENIFIKDSEWYDRCRKIGLESISKARKGKMPAVNSVTGEKVGSVDVDHPNVKSGLWVHHSKGRKLSQEEKDQKSAFSTGSNNGNYSGKTDEELYKYAEEYYLKRLYFEKKEFEDLCLMNGYPTLRGNDCFRFNEFGGGFKGLMSKLTNQYGSIPTLRTDYKLYVERKEKYAKDNKSS